MKYAHYKCSNVETRQKVDDLTRKLEFFDAKGLAVKHRDICLALSGFRLQMDAQVRTSRHN